jgi:hypothetical protein
MPATEPYPELAEVNCHSEGIIKFALWLIKSAMASHIPALMGNQLQTPAKGKASKPFSMQ